jgi:7-cyano-7-deazaguanine synthase in queuosine biosynthesis
MVTLCSTRNRSIKKSLKRLVVAMNHTLSCGLMDKIRGVQKTIVNWLQNRFFASGSETVLILEDSLSKYSRRKQKILADGEQFREKQLVIIY